MDIDNNITVTKMLMPPPSSVLTQKSLPQPSFLTAISKARNKKYNIDFIQVDASLENLKDTYLQSAIERVWEVWRAAGGPLLKGKGTSFIVDPVLSPMNPPSVSDYHLWPGSPSSSSNIFLQQLFPSTLTSAALELSGLSVLASVAAVTPSAGPTATAESESPSGEQQADLDIFKKDDLIEWMKNHKVPLPSLK
ncbi:hypothetical protein SERLADRAFT_404863 [Serpula lacrymans var. lacrymans S7.9]|uniref:Uncharacterized protein n=1 Tax=Serpula lacrymans var. lacrymans (strain S7.9) TaxID=578457 RepID=F8NFP8_SERL9|nr:uncharacterized protein SERLADRAFT_404863 [Serpula lacrymans var. lacrymans S7.9]EGO30888.1 hypothetical protein SERLADRAFT_404863 [Serpula lacrymans var. lacrymans S7.9]